MSEENYDIGADYDEADFEIEEEIAEEPSKAKIVAPKQKAKGRRARLENLLEIRKLAADLNEFDAFKRDNASYYDDDLFSELYE